jgi:ketosteroid isomerase-like protein
MDLVHESFDLLADGGFEAMIPFVHDDFVMETPVGLAAEPQRYEGPDGYRRWWTTFFEVMDEVSVLPTNYHDLGKHRVAVESTLSAKGQSSGIAAEQSTIFVVTVHEEKLLKIEFFLSLADALASEPTPS